MTADERYAEDADNNCEYCGRPPITWLEVGIVFGYTALVVTVTLVVAGVLGVLG